MASDNASTADSTEPKIPAKLIDRTPKFDFYDPITPHDKVLIVERKRFYAESEYLKVWSVEFGKIYEESKELDEIEIPNVKADDFNEMLHVIYPCRKEVKEEHCAALVDLAVHFSMPGLLRPCWERMADTYDSYIPDDSNLKANLDMFEAAVKHKMEFFMERFGRTLFHFDSDEDRQMLNAQKERISQMSAEAQALILNNILYNRDLEDLEYDEDCFPEVPQIDFSNSETPHDRILIVEEKEFYVNAKYLATWSNYFRILFFGSFKEANEHRITIQDFRANEFDLFLQAIYPGSGIINYGTVAPLLDLAFRFDAPGLIQQCVQYTNSFCQAFLEVACKHNMEDVKIWASRKILKDIEDREWFKKRIPEMSLELQSFILQHKIGAFDKYEIAQEEE